MVLPWVRRIRWLILLGGLALVVTGTVATFVGRLALPAGMLSTYLTAFAAMAFAALSILTIKATIDRMWHLGE